MGRAGEPCHTDLAQWGCTGIIADHRIERAKALLRETQLSLERIAETCGFCDASHLSNVLRRRCGKPASAYRR